MLRLKNYHHLSLRDLPKHQLVTGKSYAQALKQNGKISELSLIAIQKSVQLEPRDSNAHHNLGVILQALKRLDEAEVSFRKTIELKPDYAEAHNNLACYTARTWQVRGGRSKL